MGCKVETVTFRNDIDISELNDRLIEMYEGESGTTLRDLEEVVNVEILQTAMDKANMEYLPGEAENLYRLLKEKGDSITTGERRDAEARLEKNGVDPESVKGSFVSYQTVRNHMNNCLDIDTSNQSQEVSIEDKKETIERLMSRSEAVINRTVNKLREEGEFQIADTRTNVRASVHCEECGESFDVHDLFEEGGCGCEA